MCSIQGHADTCSLKRQRGPIPSVWQGGTECKQYSMSPPWVSSSSPRSHMHSRPSLDRHQGTDVPSPSFGISWRNAPRHVQFVLAPIQHEPHLDLHASACLNTRERGGANRDEGRPAGHCASNRRSAVAAWNSRSVLRARAGTAAAHWRHLLRALQCAANSVHR